MTLITAYFRRPLYLGLAFIVLSTSPAWGSPALLDHYHQLRNGTGETLPGTRINLTSSDQDSVLSAEVNSIVETPFETLADALAQPENWCQFIPLHFNIKACTYQMIDGQAQLTFYSGRKTYQPPEDSYEMTYQFVVMQHDESQLRLHLHADRGPVGTKRYQIVLAAIPVEEGTLLHIESSYRPSFLSTMLTRSYLATVGRGKVGFSLKTDKEGKAKPVQGIKGIIERNVMRYHIAINTFLSTQSLPDANRHEVTMTRWFRENDSYPRQLHEMDEEDYLNIKRKEWLNQQLLQQALSG